MITTGSFKDMNDTYDEIWIIVRSLKNGLPKINNTIVRHIPELSPSYKLFNKYLELKAKNNWNKETFSLTYTHQFLSDISNTTSRNYLNELYSKDKLDLNILLVCFCVDEELCHRSLIISILLGTGVNVNSPTTTLKYYDKYKKIIKDKVKLNLNKQFYKGVQIQLIDRHYNKFEAKRYMLGDVKYNQNIWIPDDYLYLDGTLKENINIDFVFKKAHYQKKFEYAKININPYEW